MEWIIGARGENSVHRNQILHTRDFCGQNDAIVRQPAFLSQLGRAHRAFHHGVHGDVARIARLRQRGVCVHHLGEQLLIETAPVHADANGFSLCDGDLHDRAKVVVAAFGADIAGIDAVLGQCTRARRILCEQQMAVVVEVADHRDVDLGDDGGHGARGLVGIDRHAHELAAGAVQRAHLRGSGGHVGGVGVGHGLDDDWLRTANQDAAHTDRDGRTSRGHGQKYSARGRYCSR